MVLISNIGTTRILVADLSYVGTARRAVKQFAEEAGLRGEPLEKLSILASELATNLAKHAESGGELIVNNISQGENIAVQLISVDRGPGIEDIDSALIDGVSGTHTLGCGLGAMRRLSDLFEVKSTPGKGTIIVSTIYQCKKNKIGCTINRLNIGYISVPHPRETRCGDCVSVAESDDLSSILVVDALGHGCDAAAVSDTASRTFQESPFDNVKGLLQRIHGALQGSRGAAVGIAQIDRCSQKLSFVGVGNISVRIFSKYNTKGFPSTCGIVGGQMGSVHEYSYDWDSNSVLLMYSDGIKSSAQCEFGKLDSPTMSAAEIHRDFARLNDDMTVLVAMNRRD